MSPPPYYSTECAAINYGSGRLRVALSNRALPPQAARETTILVHSTTKHTHLQHTSDHRHRPRFVQRKSPPCLLVQLLDSRRVNSTASATANFQGPASATINNPSLLPQYRRRFIALPDKILSQSHSISQQDPLLQSTFRRIV